MKTKININIALLSVLLPVGCKDMSDTYDFAVKKGLFNSARWSFEAGSDVYTGNATGKSLFKPNSGNPKMEYDINLYNRTDVNVNQMRAEFSNGSLWLSGVKLISHTTFEVNGLKQLAFKFVPSSGLGSTTITILFYSYAEGQDKQVSVFTLKLVDNTGPTAVMAVNPSTAAGHSNLDYILDATGSADGDAAEGGTLDSFTYTITDAGHKKQKITIKAWQGNKIVYTFPYTFPNAGEFTVKLAVTDSNGEPSAEVSKTLTVAE